MYEGNHVIDVLENRYTDVSKGYKKILSCGIGYIHTVNTGFYANIFGLLGRRPLVRLTQLQMDPGISIPRRYKWDVVTPCLGEQKPTVSTVYTKERKLHKTSTIIGKIKRSIRQLLRQIRQSPEDMLLSLFTILIVFVDRSTSTPAASLKMH